MNYLRVKWGDYIDFCHKYKTDRLDKGLKIITDGSKYSSLFSRYYEEIFNQPIECQYHMEGLDRMRLKISFLSKGGYKYRLDIFTIVEDISLINHIGFTPYDDRFDTIPIDGNERNELDRLYEMPTNRNEIFDVLGRIRWILLDLLSNDIISNNFCIGGTEFVKKNSLYEYFLKVVVGDDGFKKINTDIYPIGWALYFTI
jgi:hypothetical protein